jgi:hypothetical protein
VRLALNTDDEASFIPNVYSIPTFIPKVIDAQVSVPHLFRTFIKFIPTFIQSSKAKVKPLVLLPVKLISFINYIAQQKAEVAACNCLFKLPLNVLDQMLNKWLVLRGDRILKVMCTSPHTNLA